MTQAKVTADYFDGGANISRGSTDEDSLASIVNNIIDDIAAGGLADHHTRHLPGGADALHTAAAGTTAIGASAAEGAAASFARSDHAHAVTAPSAPADVTKAAAAAGASANFARQDHKHDITTASATGVVAESAAAAEGSATTLARSDHVHTCPATYAPTAHAGAHWNGGADQFGKTGRAVVAAAGDIAVVFPVTFTNANYTLQLSYEDNAGVAAAPTELYIKKGTKLATGFTATIAGAGVAGYIHWTAIHD